MWIERLRQQQQFHVKFVRVDHLGTEFAEADSRFLSRGLHRKSSNSDTSADVTKKWSEY